MRAFGFRPTHWAALVCPGPLDYFKGMARQSQTAHRRKEAAGAKPANLSKMPISGGYESDYYDWLSQQAKAFRAQQPDLLDWQNLARGN